MNKTIEEAEASSVRCCRSSTPMVPSRDLPLFVALKATVEICARARPGRGPEHAEDPDGAFTGEVSAPMLRELGVDAGSRPFRASQYFNETDEGAGTQGPGGPRAGGADPLRRRRVRSSATPGDRGGAEASGRGRSRRRRRRGARADRDRLRAGWASHRSQRDPERLRRRYRFIRGLLRERDAEVAERHGRLRRLGDARPRRRDHRATGHRRGLGRGAASIRRLAAIAAASA